MPTAGALQSDSAGQKLAGPFHTDGTGRAPRGANVDSPTTGQADLAVVLYDTAATPAVIAKADDAAFTVGTHYVLPVGALADETSSDQVDEGDIGLPRMSLSRVLLSSPTAKTGAAAAIVDDAAFTPATDAVVMLGGFADETSADQVDEGDGGAVRMSLSRVLLSSPTAKTGAAAAIVDDAAFTPATDAVVMIGALADETGPDAVDEGDGGALRMTLSRVLRVINSSEGGASSVIVDDAAFTPGTTPVQMIGAQCDDTATDSVNEGDGGAVRMSADRVLYTGSATTTATFSFTSPASATTTAQTAVTGLGPYRSATFYASIQGGTGGTLDIYLQWSPDGGTTWVDYMHFAQLADGAAAIQRYFSVNKYAQQATITAVGSGTTPALAANTVLGGSWGDRMRVVATAGAGTSAGTAQTLLAVFSS